MSSTSPWSVQNPWVKIGIGVVAFILIVVGFQMRNEPRPLYPTTDSYQTNDLSVGASSGMMKSSVPLIPFRGESEMALDSAAAPASPSEVPSATTPRVIKTGQLSLRVSDASKAMLGIRERVTQMGGFIESSSIQDSGQGPRSGQMTVRVPVQSFDAALGDIKAMAAVVLYESTHGQDVTEEFVDLEADLRNTRAEEASYLEILKQSGSISDTLSVTQRLADVRGRIERLEGHKRYMENRTDFASISVSVTEDTRIELPGHTWKPLEVAREAVQNLIENIQGLVDALIVIVINILPMIIVMGLLIWLAWKVGAVIVRRMRR